MRLGSDLSLGWTPLRNGNPLSANQPAPVPPPPPPPPPESEPDPTPVPWTPNRSHMHLWDSRVLDDGPVAVWQTGNGRQTLRQPNAALQPATPNGSIVFDGNDDHLFDSERTVKHIGHYILGDDIVCTGIARAPDGSWWIMDHGGNMREPSLYHLNNDFTQRLARIDLGEIYGLGVITRAQGVVYDYDDNTIWFAAKGYVRHIGTDGTPLLGSDIAFPDDPGGLAIDRRNRTLIVMQNDADGTLIRTIDKGSGATLASGTIAEPDRDHLFFDEETRTLILSAGKQYSNGADSALVFYSIDGANFMDEIGRVTVPEVEAIEGVHYSDGILTICDDAHFHADIENAVRQYDAGPLAASIWEFFGVVSFPNVDPTAALLTIGEPLGQDSYGMGVYVPGTDKLQIRVHSGGAGSGLATRSHRQFTGLPSFTSPRIVFGRVDVQADTVELWIDGMRQTAFADTGSVTTFKGPFCDRNRLNLAASYEGAPKRHLPATMPMIGYALRMPDMPDERMAMEGYLAHSCGLTGNLPAEHPYRHNGP